jgi:hypothetical protein
VARVGRGLSYERSVFEPWRLFKRCMTFAPGGMYRRLSRGSWMGSAETESLSRAIPKGEAAEVERIASE